MSSSSGPARPSGTILEELEQVIAKAHPVPLTDQVRVDREQVRELVRELREALSVGRH